MSDKKQPNGVVETSLEFEGLAADSLATLEPPSTPTPEPPVEAETQALQSVAPATASSAPVVDGEAAEPEVVITAPPAEPVTPPAETGVVSIAALEADKPSVGDKIGQALTKAGALFQGRGWLAGAIIAVLLIIFMFLPPISLGQRLASGGGYATLTAAEPFAHHADGIWVHAAPEALGKLKVRLGTVPQADFVAARVDAALQPALETLPAHLAPKSPYYTIELRGKETGPATIEVDIPNEAEPWETLDLYTWNGSAWQWIPTRLDRAGMKLFADVAVLPGSVVVMQTSLTQQKVAAEVNALPLTGDVAAVLTEANVPGALFIGTLGGVTQQAGELPRAGDAGVSLAPVVRNWAPGRDANWALVVDMLNTPAYRQAHIENLVDVAQSGGYNGVVLDYRMLPVSERATYASFVRELASAFHAPGLWLAVMVDMPQQQADGSWDTGGYDWYALGAAVDQLRVVMPLDPTAYVSGGKVEQLLSWAISQVDRYKLMPIFSALSTDGENLLTLADLLAPLNEVRVSQTVTESVEPGTTLNFELGTGVMVEIDPATGATRVTDREQSLWLGSPQWLRTRLDLAARYNLGGVVLRDLTAEGNAPNLAAAIADYRGQVANTSYALPGIVWTVTGPDGQAQETQSSLSQPGFAWTTPDITGTYRIAASIAGMDKGALEIQVLDSAPVVAEEDPEPEEDVASGTTTTPAQTEVLRAAFVADVSVPDNTRFEKGESFVKTWRIKNTGATAWPENTVLAYASGERMSNDNQVIVGKVEPGATVDISVNMAAPNSDGTFRGVWRLMSGDRQIEGGGMFVQIKAGEEAVAAPAPAPAPAPGPVAPVSGGSFQLGGHIRDYGLPYANQMRYAGMTWTKVQAHFGHDKSGIIQASHANGFKIQVSALGPPGMVTEAGYEQRYAEWVAGIAAAGADAIEVWNEPNIDREWQIGHISPQAYTNLLCTAYRAIKAANPNTAVISAAPAPTGWFGGCSANGCDDIPWMQGLAAAGAANCMDFIGAHHNAGATSPSARSGHPTGSTHHSWYFLPQTEAYFNIFGGARKLFYTEMGYASQEGVPEFSDAFAWARGINNAQQAAWLAEAASIGANTGMVRCIIVWNIDFGRYGYDPQDGFAIIRPGGGCPACDTLNQVMGGR